MNLIIEGNTNFVDERLNFIVTGLLSGIKCKISIQIDYSWSNCPSFAWGVYQADSTGCVNLALQAPLKGSYTGIDSMGLFACCKEKVQIVIKRNKRDFTEEYILCNFTISDGDTAIKKSIKRSFTNPQIKCKRFRYPVVGYYYYHSAGEDCNQVILLGGSEGVINPMLPIASCLANKGLDVLILQYFSPCSDPSPVKKLPLTLCHIPIEYVDKAVSMLCQLRSKKYVSIIGYSRGAELSLLTSSFNNKIKKVVAVSPSAYLWQGINTLDSAWCHKGEPMPYLKILILFSMIDNFKNLIGKIFPFPQGYYLSYEFSRRLYSKKYKEKARIRIENSNADILLIGGSQDSVWNSEASIHAIEKKLNNVNYNRAIVSKIYKDMGHYFYPPFIFGIEKDGGGRDKLLMSKINEDSWSIISDFLLN